MTDDVHLLFRVGFDVETAGGSKRLTRDFSAEGEAANASIARLGFKIGKFVPSGESHVCVRLRLLSDIEGANQIVGIEVLK